MNSVCVSLRWRSRRGSTCVASPMASVSNLPSSTLRAWWVRCCRSWWRPVGSNCTGSWWNTRSRGFQTSTCQLSTSGTSPLPSSTRWRPREPKTIATCFREKTSGTRRRHRYSPTNSPGSATTFRQNERRTCTCGSTACLTSSVANGCRSSTKSLSLITPVWRPFSAWIRAPSTRQSSTWATVWSTLEWWRSRSTTPHVHLVSLV